FDTAAGKELMRLSQGRELLPMGCLDHGEWARTGASSTNSRSRTTFAFRTSVLRLDRSDPACIDHEALTGCIAPDHRAGDPLRLRQTVKVVPLIRLSVREHVRARVLEALQTDAAGVASRDHPVSAQTRGVHRGEARAARPRG